MGVSPDFVEFLKDQLSEFGPVSVRRMFGGAGIFRNGTMFALVAGETVYFKADHQTKPEFEAEGLAPFSYSTKNGTNTLTSYWRAPERCLDDPEMMVEWAGKAWGAALRAHKP
jgi:DNA transformation protein